MPTVRPPELETIEILLDGGVATVLLNRPQQRNAWTLQMSEDMSAALAWCDRTDAVGGVVVSGRGPYFCVGADLSGRDILRPGGEPDREPPAPRQILWPSAVRKPVVAALHGHAIGIGMTFSLHCDVRFVAEDAKVGLPFVRRGVVPEANANWLLPRTVGLPAALDLVLTGRTLLGREAAELGLCHSALPAGEVLDAATYWVAQVVADGAPLALGLAKWLLWNSQASGPDEAWAKERTAFEACAGSADAAEGVAAFLERRPARWQEQVSVAWPRVLDTGQD